MAWKRGDEPSDDYKPSINAVAVIFQAYWRSMANSNMPNSRTEGDAWEAQARANRDELEKQLRQVGLAKYIDWE